jgi:hypothetical protein
MKGYYLPHYKDSDSPSAMRYPAPAWNKEPEQLPDLAMIEPLGERIASDPELIHIIEAYNDAPGRLPETPDRTLLQQLPEEGSDVREATLASMATYDEKSNGIVYLSSKKFIYAPELRDFTNGRDTPKNGRSSKQVINEYKDKMTYDTMPPVEHVKAYYEEQSGNTYYALVGDGSHRLAGAVRRGDEYVPATSVSFIRLETNVISEQLEEMLLQQEAPKRRRLGHTMLERLGVRKPRKL